MVSPLCLGTAFAVCCRVHGVVGCLMCCVLVSVSHALGWRRFGMSWWCVSGDLVASWWSVGDVLV